MLTLRHSPHEVVIELVPRELDISAEFSVDGANKSLVGLARARPPVPFYRGTPTVRHKPAKGNAIIPNCAATRQPSHGLAKRWQQVVTNYGAGTLKSLLKIQLQRLLEDTGEIKGTPAFMYGCEGGCGAKDLMDFRTPPASGIKIESVVIHEQQDSAWYKQLDHSLANRL